MTNKPYFIYGGTDDIVNPIDVWVKPLNKTMKSLNADIKYVEKPFNHKMPRIGLGCKPNDTHLVPKFVTDLVPLAAYLDWKDCGYNLVGESFTFLFDNLNPPDDTGPFQLGVLKEFSQSEFFEASIFEDIGLDEVGYIFYPEKCIKKSCKLHIHLHGCM